MPRQFRALALVAVASCSSDSSVRELDDYEVVVRDDVTSLIVTAERCGELRVSTAETDAEVRLTVMQIQGDDCAYAESEPVSLTRPLGDRVIVDQPTGDVVTPS